MRSAVVVRVAALAALLAAAGAPAQIVWVGDEIPVNGFTPGSQFAAAIAGDGAGGFFVAWQSADVDGSGFGIRARRFAADGTAATPELAVNSTTAGNQVSPSVARLADGSYAIAWASIDQDGSGFGIVARRFSAAGSPLTGEVTVNSTTAGNQSSPRLAAAPAALEFVVTWTGPSAAGDNDVYARRYAASGTALGAESRINALGSGQQISPDVAWLDSGTLVFVWASEGADGSGYGIRSRRESADLSHPNPELPVNEIAALDQTSPAVAGFGPASYVVVWERALQSPPLPVGPQTVIASRRFATDGSPLADERLVTPDSGLRHESPSVAAIGSGYLVAWDEFEPDTGQPEPAPPPVQKDAVAARFRADDSPDSGNFTLNTTVLEDQIDPVLVAGAGRRFVAAWASFDQDGVSFGIFAQRFGEPLEPCAADAETLCFHDGRFRVRANFSTAAGASGDARAEPLTDESGYFTFFDPENVEIVVKAIDACGLAGFENFWIFATGLTNVRVTMLVEDTWTGEFRQYDNPLNADFQPILDTAHLQVCDAVEPAAGAAPSRGVTSPPAPSRGLGFSSAATPVTFAATGTCIADADTLCLRDGRFEVEIDWTTALPSSGHGQAEALTDESGYFWFFDPANVELVIKVIDGCSFNGHYWLFAGGLTDVGTRLTVRDTQHPGAVFEREKEIGVPFAPILTIEAFDTCP